LEDFGFFRGILLIAAIFLLQSFEFYGIIIQLRGLPFTKLEKRTPFMKRSLLMLLFVCAGIVLGTLVEQLADGISWLSWLAFGMNFGITSPFVLDLGVLTLTFGATFNLSVSVILFTVIAVLCGFAIFRRK
jgi:hypothetical protein